MEFEVIPVAATTPSPASLEDLAKKIRDGASGVDQMVVVASGAINTVVHRVVAVGQLLMEAKKLAGHGQFAKWLESNVPNVSARTARRYMQMAKLPIGRDTMKAFRGACMELDDRPTARASRKTPGAGNMDRFLQTWERRLTVAVATGGTLSDEQAAAVGRVQQLLSQLLNGPQIGKTAKVGRFEGATVPAARRARSKA